eukprot:7717165-Pyramimonas_sp.AAC.1
MGTGDRPTDNPGTSQRRSRSWANNETDAAGTQAGDARIPATTGPGPLATPTSPGLPTSVTSQTNTSPSGGANDSPDLAAQGVQPHAQMAPPEQNTAPPS